MFLFENIYDMKNTWNGINNLIDSKKVNSKVIPSIKCLNDYVITNGPHEISNIHNIHLYVFYFHW